MKRCLLFALILVGAPSYQQEVKHAPTVEQCRADQKLWLSKLENENSVVSISFKELSGWLREMGECRTVDPQFHNQYYNTAAEIDAEEVIRLEAFLDQHNLYDGFVAEDAQGKRR
jgi:hypothetical protein